MTQPFRVCALLLLALAHGFAEAPDDAGGSPEKIVSTLLRSGCRGLPVGPLWKQLKPLLSADFALVISRAQELQARAIKEFPDEKPPWIEGDFFSSLFEGPTSFTVGKPTKDADGMSMRVPVAMEHAADGVVEKWTDTFVLVLEGGSWKVDDLAFGGEWDFAAQGLLKESLRESLTPEP